jgi:two-component system invasion response regulator UvrY
MTRVLLVDDHPLVRRGLREMLTAAGITVVAEASRSEEVLPALDAHPCDIVLLDLSLPGRGGIEVLRDIGESHPRMRVLVVSTHAEASYAVRAMRAGAAGYITKTSAPEEIVAAVRAVAATGRYINDAVAGALADFALEDRPGPRHEQLSDREMEVFRLLTRGRTVSEIAGDLSLNVKTVSTYHARLKQKLGAGGSADLMRYALEHHLFD